MKEQEEAVKKQIAETEKAFSEYAKNAFSIPYSHFRVLTTSIKQYEILSDIELIIHIAAEDRKTLEDIYGNVSNVTSFGRSEDFVEIKETAWVTLEGCEDELESEYPAYLAIENVRKQKILTKDKGMSRQVIGTKYALPKLYTIGENGQRVFDRKKVLYASNYAVSDIEDGDGIYVDWLEDGKYYIVNLV